MPKLHLAHTLPAQPAIFLVALPVLAGKLCAATALSHCRWQRFKRVGSGLKVLTRRCIGSASPPAELHTLEISKKFTQP